MIRTSRYAFQRRGPTRLEVRYTRMWDDVEIRMDAVEVGRTNLRELRHGVEYVLFDRSLLRLWIEDAPGPTFLLNVTRNGHPLPGSGSDPVMSVRNTVRLLWTIVAMQLFVGGIKTWLDATNDREDMVPLDAAAFATGVLIAILGVLAWRRSSWALIAAWLLFWGEVVIWWSLHFRIGMVMALEAVPLLSAAAYFMTRSIKAALELDAMRLPIRRPPHHAA